MPYTSIYLSLSMKVTKKQNYIKSITLNFYLDLTYFQTWLTQNELLLLMQIMFPHTCIDDAQNICQQTHVTLPHFNQWHLPMFGLFNKKLVTAKCLASICHVKKLLYFHGCNLSINAQNQNRRVNRSEIKIHFCKKKNAHTF